MKIFNIKFKWMLAAYALFIVGSLYGCGDTISQSATGGGSNSASTGDGDSVIITPLPEGDTEAGGASTFGTSGVSDSGHLPSHCPVEVSPVEALVGCSVDSFAECKCWDPTNPAQLK